MNVAARVKAYAHAHDAERYREIVDTIEFRGWRFVIGEDAERSYLQVVFDAPDTELSCLHGCGASHREPLDGACLPALAHMWERRVREHRGRKWRLSPHMTRSEIVQTALMAVLAAVEHEAREEFRYRGEAIYGPHHDIEALHAMTRGSACERRA